MPCSKWHLKPLLSASTNLCWAIRLKNITGHILLERVNKLLDKKSDGPASLPPCVVGDTSLDAIRPAVQCRCGRSLLHKSAVCSRDNAQWFVQKRARERIESALTLGWRNDTASRTSASKSCGATVGNPSS